MAEEQGADPKALQTRPMVWEHLDFAWSAWWELHTDRPMGFAVGPIPFTAIDAYARRFGIMGADRFEAFAALVRAMDGVYLEWANKKAEKPK